ncbi:transposase [bacterium]|nr:transposase [bacterium]
MPNYRRVQISGGTYFFTLVTYRRRSFLTTSQSRKILHQVWSDAARKFPFQTDAVCLLPDHIHFLMTLPENDSNYSIRIREIKRRFSMKYREIFGSEEIKNESRIQKKETNIWQRRFWEHYIKDENDLHNHIEYIHFNPVKHGLVNAVKDWPWSSFHRYIRQGYYDIYRENYDSNDLSERFGE